MFKLSRRWGRQHAAHDTLGHEQTTALLADYPLARTDDQDRVIVDVYLDGSVPLDQAAKDFESLGCSVIAKLDWYRNGVLSLYLPLDQAVALANTKGVSTVQLSPKPRRHGDLAGRFRAQDRKRHQLPRRGR